MAASSTAGPVKVVVVGEAGNGKSTLVNHLVDTSRLGATLAEVGRSPTGVTKEIRAYVGKTCHGRPLTVVDTPGIGGEHLPLLIAQLETCFTDAGGIHGIIFAAPVAEPRLKLGGTVLQVLLEASVANGTEKWNSVIFAGTKLDRIEDSSDTDHFMQNTVPAFFQGCPGKYVLSSKEGCNGLLDAIAALPPTAVPYAPPPSSVLAARLAPLLGLSEQDFQSQLDLARGGHLTAIPSPPKAPAQEPLKLLVVGECGDGKSTLINALRDPARSDEVATGRSPTGVTKEPQGVHCLPVGGRPVVLLDTPGVGDHDVPLAALVDMLEGALEGGVDGILVTSPSPNTKLRLGAQMVRALVELGCAGESLAGWRSVILIGTKADRAEEGERSGFLDSVKKSFYRKAPGGTGVAVLCSVKTPNGLKDLKQAITQLSARMPFKLPARQAICEAICEICGLNAQEFQAQMEASRQLREELVSLFRRQAEEERLQQAELDRMAMEEMKLLEMQEAQERDSRELDAAQERLEAQWRQQSEEMRKTQQAQFEVYRQQALQEQAAHEMKQHQLDQLRQQHLRQLKVQHEEKRRIQALHRMERAQVLQMAERRQQQRPGVQAFLARGASMVVHCAEQVVNFFSPQPEVQAAAPRVHILPTRPQPSHPPPLPQQRQWQPL